MCLQSVGVVVGDAPAMFVVVVIITLDPTLAPWQHAKAYRRSHWLGP
jgi:hypothetical protein